MECQATPVHCRLKSKPGVLSWQTLLSLAALPPSSLALPHALFLPRALTMKSQTVKGRFLELGCAAQRVLALQDPALSRGPARDSRCSIFHFGPSIFSTTLAWAVRTQRGIPVSLLGRVLPLRLPTRGAGPGSSVGGWCELHHLLHT